MVKQIKWLWRYSDGFRLRILATILLGAFAVGLGLLFAQIVKIYLDYASEDVQFYLLEAVVWLVGLKLMQLLCEQADIYIRGINTARMETALEYRMFCALTSEKNAKASGIHSGDGIYRLSSDVGLVAEGMVSTVPNLVYSVVQLIATWCYLMTMQPILTVIIGVLSPVMIIATYYYTRLLTPVAREVRKLGSKVNAYLQEHLQHAEMINAFNQNGYVRANVKNYQRQFLYAMIKRIRITVTADSITELGFAMGYLAVFVWGLYSIPRGRATYGELVVFLQLVGQLQRPVFMFKDQYPSFVSALASVERLQEICDREEDEEGLLCTRCGESVGVRFEEVSFSYENTGRTVLNRFSHDFLPGSVTAVVGETGTGKSTLLKLILGLLRPKGGRVLLYDRNSGREMNADSSARGDLLYVPQGNTLLSGTVRYNLSLGNPDASEAQMMAALHIANADFVVQELDEGLDTVIGERGYTLSEGQAQRIAIARGLLKDSPVLLLDEPSSALDSATEEVLFRRLFKNAKGKTVIVITHRIADPALFDNIVRI